MATGTSWETHVLLLRSTHRCSATGMHVFQRPTRSRSAQLKSYRRQWGASLPYLSSLDKRSPLPLPTIIGTTCAILTATGARAYKIR